MEPAELISAIRAGSREAFDEMCGRYYAPLTAYARLFLNGNWAQDVVQDVFVNVWVRREALDPGQSLYGYLLRSVYNQSVNYVNKHRHACSYRSYYQERIESIGYAYYDPDRQTYDQIATVLKCLSHGFYATLLSGKSGSRGFLCDR